MKKIRLIRSTNTFSGKLDLLWSVLKNWRKNSLFSTIKTVWSIFKPRTNQSPAGLEIIRLKRRLSDQEVLDLHAKGYSPNQIREAAFIETHVTKWGGD